MTAFRDRLDLFEEANAQVLGISVDSFAAAGEYEDKLRTGFPLLSDFPRNQTGRDYEVFNEQFGIHARTTFVIDSNRILQDIYSEPRDFESHPVHALEVLAKLNV